MRCSLLFVMIVALASCRKDNFEPVPAQLKYEIKYRVFSSTLKELWINTMAPDGSFPLIHCRTGNFECTYYSNELPKDQALQVSAYDTAAKTTDSIKIVISVNNNLKTKEVTGLSPLRLIL